MVKFYYAILIIVCALNSISSQELTENNGLYQINNSFTYSEYIPGDGDVMLKFNKWLSKIDTIETVTVSGNNYSGYCLLSYNGNAMIKYNLSFNVVNGAYSYSIHNIKYSGDSISYVGLESLPDNDAKLVIISKLNEHLEERLKTLDTELQDF